MPRVVPSQIVIFIDKSWPGGLQRDAQLHVQHFGSVAALVDLVQRLPDDLLVMEPQRYARLTAGLAALRAALPAWQAGEKYHTIYPLEGFGNTNPVTLIREALLDCQDEAVSVETPLVQFVTDASFSASLRLDVGSAQKALGNGEWKAATVLAGSVIEALLLWAITRHGQPDWEQAMEQAVAAKLIRDRKGHPNDWHLPEYIEVAGVLGCIRAETRIEARQTKDYRTLIHAGAAIRAAAECDLGTAHIAVGTMAHVIRDLAQKGLGGRCP